jgi:hypothetical protein
MKKEKWICEHCGNDAPCKLKCTGDSIIPKLCPFSADAIPEWKRKEKDLGYLDNEIVNEVNIFKNENVTIVYNDIEYISVSSNNQEYESCNTCEFYQQCIANGKEFKMITAIMEDAKVDCTGIYWKKKSESPLALRNKLIPETK